MAAFQAAILAEPSIFHIFAKTTLSSHPGYAGPIAVAWTHAMLHALKFDPITELTRTTASAVKEHWRKVMQEVRERQMVLITNHNEPQAVIISAEQYQALQAQVVDLQRNLASLREQTPALQQLRDSFDARLSSLDDASAGRKARALLRKPARLKGKVQAGTGY